MAEDDIEIFKGFKLSKTNLIIIASVGGTILLLLVILLTFCICRCRKKAKERKLLKAEKKINNLAQQKLDPNLKKSEMSKVSAQSITT
uniref:Uncharacterized protein n=1 Tax=Strongyloides venezuelensis TaxID=75913 RepID=A0A0K0F5T8_STRVS